MNTERIHNSLLIHVRMSFSRSSGPGGQNCNKVNTKVLATVSINDIEGLTENERNQLIRRLNKTLHNGFEIAVTVQDERQQGLNRQIAVNRLEQRIIQAARLDPVRHKTKPTHASKVRRLKSKKIRSVLKGNRTFPFQSDT